jgi:hypothetical protein
MNKDAAKMRGVWTNLFDGMKTSLQGMWQGLTGGNGLSGLFNNLGKGIMDGLGNLLSGGISSLMSTGMDLAIKGISKLFGIGKSQGRLELEDANREIRALQDNLLETYGSLDRIREIGGAAGEELAAAWGSQNRAGLEHFKDLLGDFNLELERQNDELERQQRITGVVDDLLGTRYFEDMKDFQEAYGQLTAEQLANDIVLERIVKRYLQLQKETGQVIPGLEEMAQAWLANEAAAKAAADQVRRTGGELKKVQASVDKITWPGGTFKPPTQAEIDLFLKNNPGDVHRIRDAFTNTPGEVRQQRAAVEALTDATVIQGDAMVGLTDTAYGATDAIEQLTDVVDTLVDDVVMLGTVIEGVSTTMPVTESDAVSGIPLEDGVIPMADGGRGRVTKPTLFLAGERGAEDFAFSGGGKSFGDQRYREGGGAVLNFSPGSIVLNAAGKNADQLARELAPKMLEQIGRFNVGGSRRTLRVIAGTA